MIPSSPFHRHGGGEGCAEGRAGVFKDEVDLFCFVAEEVGERLLEVFGDEGHLLVDGAVDGDVLFLDLRAMCAMTHDAGEGCGDEAGGARDDDAREILQQVQLKCVEFLARLFFEDGSGFVTVEVGIGDDRGQVDAREGERSGLAEDVGERLAVDFAEVASRDHLFEVLCAGLFGGFVDVPVILRRAQLAEAARFHVDDGGRLGTVRKLLEVAGVLPRGVD